MTSAAAPPLACIILAAGRGKRMQSALPKVAHPLGGRPLVSWVLDAVSALKPEKTIVVLAPDMQDLAGTLQPLATIAYQQTANGTGDAVRAALPALGGFTGDVLILLGDMPLITPATLTGLIQARHRDDKTALAVLGAEFAQPPAFGRLIRGGDGSLIRIVEDRDCTFDERSLRFCNLGAFCVDSTKLASWIDKLDDKNAQGEFYLTDIVAIAVAEGARAHIHLAHDAGEARGVNSRVDLAALEGEVQARLRQRAMENGATLIAPDTVTLAWDTTLGRDVTVEPFVFFGPGVRVADTVRIRAFSHLEGATVSAGAIVGPYARLRPGAAIGEGAHIGNFVEIKNAVIGAGVKANHHAYIGDADIGAGVNFSCGAITVNYDGVHKHKTVIGENAMIGSNVSLIAPVTIGSGAYIAAGSTITDDIPGDALAIARSEQTIRPGWALNRRKKKAAD